MYMEAMKQKYFQRSAYYLTKGRDIKPTVNEYNCKSNQTYVCEGKVQ